MSWTGFRRPARNAIPAALALAAMLLCATARGADAPAPPVKSVELVLSREADAEVVRGVFATKPGATYAPESLAGDLYRLGALGYALGRVEARFGPDGLAVSIAATAAEKVVPPSLVSMTLTGGVEEVDRECRRLLGPRATTLLRRSAADYFGMLRDAAAIEAAYRAAGYLDARVAAVALDTGPDRQSARLTIQVEPGRRFTLGAVRVNGAREIKAADLAAALELSVKLPWTDGLRFELIRRAVRFCADRGYIDAKLDVAADRQVDGTVTARIELTEGERFVLEAVEVRGAEGPAREAVAAKITLRKGEPIRYSDVERLRRSVEDLGLFSAVDTLFVPVRDKAGNRNVVIEATPIKSARETGEAERFYYEMAKNLVRLYNGSIEPGAAAAGLKSLRVSGFFVADGRRVEVDALAVRPDLLRVRVTVPGVGAEKGKVIVFWRKGGSASVYLSPLGRAVRLPNSLDVHVRFALLASDAERGVPSEPLLGVEVTPASGAPGEVVRFGGYCPPAAAHFTRQAGAFARKAPGREPSGALVLPGVGEADGPTKVALDGNNLPRRVTILSRTGETTADFAIDINGAVAEADLTAPAEVTGASDDAAGLAVLLPAIAAAAPGDVALGLAEKAAADNPRRAECLAVRGILRAAWSEPATALADLRAAAAASSHPSYALLLAEALIRAREFAEAKTVCRRLLDARPAKPAALDIGDILLESTLSLSAASDALLGAPADPSRRARIDCVLAHIGLGEHREAAELLRKMLDERPADGQAAELLARCELSLGDAKGALRTLAGAEPGPGRPELDLYAALAHHALNDEDRAASSLAAAMKKAPMFRNLLLVQQRAGEIDARQSGAAAKAALARVFSRAALGALSAEDKAKIAAIVNDACVLKADVEALARDAAGPDGAGGPDFAKVRAAALERIIDDMLILRWAAWRGMFISDAEVEMALREEMRREGLEEPADYAKRLEQTGRTLASRRAEIHDTLLKKTAFATVLADRLVIQPGEVRAYYEARRQQFKVPPSARLRMITLHFVRFRDKDEAVRLAAALRERVRAKPETFEAVAREYSHDANASRGGLWDNVAQGSFLGALDEAVFRLKEGELSAVIETDRGCHVVRIEKLTGPRDVPLAEAAPYIVRAMQELGARGEISAWLRELRAQSYVEVLDK